MRGGWAGQGRNVSASTVTGTKVAAGRALDLAGDAIRGALPVVLVVGVVVALVRAGGALRVRVVRVGSSR
jgi:hypothetical protein